KIATDRNKVLQLLIEEKIINQQVKKLELTASDQEIDGQIKSILKRNGITDAQLAERLKMLGTTMTEYRDGIRRQLERRNLVEREIRPSLETSDEQLRHYYLSHSGPEDGELQYKIAQILIENPKKGSANEKLKAVTQQVKEHPEKFSEIAKDYSD